MNNAASKFLEHVDALLAGVAADLPVVMINLLRYRDRAQYPAHSTGIPATP